MMNKEEIAPHVKEIARVLEGKVKEQDIEKDLDNYLNVYRMSLEASKRHIVRKYGGDPNALTKGERKLLSQLGLSEQSVDLLVRVMSSNTREVMVGGSPKTIESGILADENGNTVKHMLAAEAIMRALAKHFGESEEEWGLAGLLHDIDLELTEGNMKQHAKLGADLAREMGASPAVVHAILTHNQTLGIPLETKMDKALY